MGKLSAKLKDVAVDYVATLKKVGTERTVSTKG